MGKTIKRKKKKKKNKVTDTKACHSIKRDSNTGVFQ